jgi:hypothetical protein
MKFVIRWSVANENYTGAMKKFLETVHFHQQE